MEFKPNYRQKDKGWQVQIFSKQNGKWKYETSKQGFAKKSEAKKWAEGDGVNKVGEIEKLKEKYQSEGNLDPELVDITLRDYIDIYRAAKRIHIEKNTEDGLDYAFKWLDPFLGIPVNEFSPLNAQTVVNNMIESRRLKNSSIRGYVTKIRALFNDAADLYKLIKENPFPKKLKLPKEKVVVVKTKIEKSKALSEEEAKLLLRLVKEATSEKLYMVTLLIEQTGMRVGEATSVCEDDFDFVNGEIRVWRQWKKKKDGTYGFGTLKSPNSVRTIPMPLTLRHAFKSYFERRKIVSIDRRVFNITAAYASTELRRLFARLGFKATAHSLRHTYATKLLQRGLDFAAVGALIGDTPAMVAKTYAHVTVDSYDRAKKIVENF